MVEHLLCKNEALSSNACFKEKKKKKSTPTPAPLKMNNYTPPLFPKRLEMFVHM
jgi:hypothetical protein